MAAHELVYGELLVGDCGGRGKQLSAYEQLHLTPTIPHHDVVEFVRNRGLHGRGLNWIDVHILASAAAHRLDVWSVDERFAVRPMNLTLLTSRNDH